MRRLAFLLILLLLIPSISQARPRGIYKTVASGTVTKANMRLSGVDGLAFVDFGAANVLTTKVGHLLKITDSAGKSIMGYIKAAMAGESLDTEVATGTLTALKLYKITATEANHFGTGKVVGSYFTSAGTETCDANNKVQCVLVGATTGVTIVSSKGGATYNWFNKDSAFNWNDASGYTYQIIKENRTTLIATSNITAGNALMDTTTANAFAAPVGVDLTAYQDGRHLAHFTDSSGYVAVGWISATAPSGEALGAEINSGTLTISKLYKITATEANHFGTGYLVDRYFTSLGTETCDANNKVKENTMPAATGALLLSSKGGSRGYLYKHASFDPNGALTLKILFMGD